MARAGNALKATTDQVAVPTFVDDLAAMTLELLRADASGLFHAVNDEGVSRFDWTRAILDEALRAGLISSAPTVEPVPTSFFKSPMKRPGYSVLNNEKVTKALGRKIGSWRGGVRKMLAHERGR
jgi:dTDP-4-dehydrorhamnose reductase